MISTRWRAPGAVLILFAGCISSANATNVVLDSEQRAAAAVLTAIRLRAEVPLQVAGLTYGPKDYVERTLRLLETEFSPEALRQARGGVLVSCPGGGSLRARLSRTTHVLDIDWNECSFQPEGTRTLLTGPARVTLCEDDLTPDIVTQLSVGNSSRDLVVRTSFGGAPPDPNGQTARNVRLAGQITLGRASVDYPFDGSFSYSLDGYYFVKGRSRMGVPGEVYQDVEVRLTASHAWVSGTMEHGDLGWREDVRINLGNFSSRTYYGPVLDQPEIIYSSGFDAVALRVANSGDYMVDSESFEISGWANYQYRENESMSCANGGYAFKTRIPARYPSEFEYGPDSFDQGEIQINGSTVARFSANADPAELGEMHVDLDVAHIGSFAYDGNGFWETQIPSVAQCSN